MNEIVKKETALAVGFETIGGFEALYRMAKALSGTQMLPDHLRGESNIPNLIMILNMSLRMNLDPLMVACNVAIIQGRPSVSAQLAIARFNTLYRDRYSSISYEMSGTKGQDNWGCTAYVLDKQGGRHSGPEVTIGIARKEGWYDKQRSKWQTIPELMLRYRAAAWLIRTVAPEALLGLQTQEEAEDIIDLPSSSVTELRPPPAPAATPVQTIQQETEAEVEVEKPVEVPATATPAAVTPPAVDDPMKQIETLLTAGNKKEAMKIIARLPADQKVAAGELYNKYNAK